MASPILMDFPDSFETRRLLIRSPMPGDGAEKNAAVLETFDELKPWMEWARKRPTVEESEEGVRRARVRFLERKDLMLHVYLKGTDTLIGSSGLHRIDWEIPKFEIGYWLRAGYTGYGYMTEAVRGISAFDSLGAKRVEIRCDSGNSPSARVAERAGFRLEGELRNAEIRPDGTVADALVFSMLPDEYEVLREGV